jgi:hypothetical protein
MTVIWIDSSRFGPVYDADAQAYISAVETADGQGLETGVKNAINNFVVGCKADGIWNALKSTFILSGARTINGALVPLKSSMPTPTRFGTEAGWTYGRTTGLKGNGTNNYIKTGYFAPTSSTNNNHLAFWKNSNVSANSGENIFGGYYLGFGDTVNLLTIGETYYYNNSLELSYIGSIQTGLHGTARTNSTQSQEIRPGISLVTQSSTSIAMEDAYEIFLYNINYFGDPFPESFYDEPFSFYSTGDFLNLENLTTRVTNLTTAISTALS